MKTEINVIDTNIQLNLVKRFSLIVPLVFSRFPRQEWKHRYCYFFLVFSFMSYSSFDFSQILNYITRLHDAVLPIASNVVYTKAAEAAVTIELVVVFFDGDIF